MKYLIFDIETVPNGEAGWEPPPDNPDAFPPPPAWRIVSIGGMLLSLDVNGFDKNQVLHFDTFGKPNNEIEMLLEFLHLCEKEEPLLVTFNGRRFDIPVIEQRCMRWGIQAPFLFDWNLRNRYKEQGHFDLVDQISNYGASWAGKLANICAPLGMPGKMDVEGAKVQELIANGKQQEVDSYCLCDVAETAWLLVRYLHLRGTISGTTNHNAVHAIKTACLAKDNPMLTMLVEKTNINRLDLEEQEELLVNSRIPDEEDCDEDPDLPF